MFYHQKCSIVFIVNIFNKQNKTGAIEMDPNVEKNNALINNDELDTTYDELEATDLAEISGGTGKGGYGGKKDGGDKSITIGNIDIIDDIGSNNTINIFDGPKESSGS